MIRRLGIFLFTAAVFCTARVITFSATSSISQADADKQALSGIALQIRANVSTSHQVQKSEVSGTGKESKLSKNYSETIDVNSDVILNGVELQHERPDKKTWKTNARFDTEKATAAERKKIREVQRNAASLDSLIRISLSKENYDAAIRAFSDLVPLELSHQRLYADASVFEIPDDSYLFQVDIPAWEARITEAVSHLKLSLEKEAPAKAENGKWGPVILFVTGKNGPVEGVEVFAKQGQKILGTEKSDESGKVQFTLDGVESSSGTHEVLFRIRLSPFGGQKFSRERPVSYTSDAKICPYKLECGENPVACTSVESILSQAGFENGEGPKLRVLTTILDKNVFDGGPKKITTLNLSVEIRGEGILFQKNVKGSGSSEMAATANAIRKISSKELQRQLSSLCSAP